MSNDDEQAEYSAGGIIPGPCVPMVGEWVGERVFMNDGPVYEWTGAGWVQVPGAPNPLARAILGEPDVT